MGSDSIHYDADKDDGIFHGAPEILTDEEYFSKVGFDQHLLSTFNLFEKDGTYYRHINSRQGYIQKGRFRPENLRKVAWNGLLCMTDLMKTQIRYFSTLAIF